LRLERICLSSLVGNKFGYNVIAACATTPTLYCSVTQKPTTWTQKAPCTDGLLTSSHQLSCFPE